MMSLMWTFCAVLMLNYWTTESAPAITNRQLIPPLPGYIPVYIRTGNTPLEDINLELAEAFQSYALKQARINALKDLSENGANEDSAKDQDLISLNNINSEDEENSKSNTILYTQRPSQHIQKISRNN